MPLEGRIETSGQQMTGMWSRYDSWSMPPTRPASCFWLAQI